MPRHRNRFLVPQGHLVSAGGRQVREGEVCDEAGAWEWVELQNEHLTLEADSRHRALEIVEGDIVPPIPCEPGSTNFGIACSTTRPVDEQQRDFQWAIDADRIIREVTQQGVPVPRLRKELFATPYRSSTAVPLISARLVFDRGTVAAHRLDPQGSGYRIYEVRRKGANRPILRQAVATQVELSLDVRGPVTFRARSLDGTGAEPKPIVIDGGESRELVVFVENDPDFPCGDQRREGPHFMANFHLLDHPDRLEELPGPEDTSPGPSWNGQCSPPKFAFPEEGA